MLARCGAEGARTVLVLESQAAGHTRFDPIGNQLPVLLAGSTYLPAEVFLVETYDGPISRVFLDVVPAIV